MKSNTKYEHTPALQEIEHLKVMGKKAEANKISTTEHRTESEIKTRRKKHLDKLKHWKLPAFLILLATASTNIQAQSLDSIAVNLDGSSGTISIPHNAALMPSTAMTIEAWIYADDISTNEFYEIYRKEDGNNRQLFSFQEYGTILSFGINTGGAYAELDAPIDTADFEGKWVHVAATYDGSFKRVFVNGLVIDSAATSGSLPATGSATSFIGSSTGFVEFFDGKIDEFRIWSVARTKKELTASKDRRLSGGESGLELYLPFDENAGATTADLSVNGLTATLTGGVTWDFGTIISFKKGSGTAADPYQVTTVEELQTMNAFPAAHYILMNDIDASATAGWNNGAGFDPIAEGVGPFFSGTFDGKNYTIDSLYINRGAENYVALFGYVTGTVARVRLTNMDITGRDLVGGIAGFNDGVINTSSVSGTISASSFSGGLAGWNDGSIFQCFTEGSVSGTDFYVGGLAGFSDEGSISDSYSLSAVSLSGGSTDVGGLVGRTVVSNAITNSYSAGTVSGTTNGGLVGSVSGTLTTTQSFWDIQATGQSGSAAGTGKTMMEMKNKSTFTGAGWNYSTIWYQRSGENTGYPQLQVHVADSGTVPSVSGVTFTGSLVAGDSLFASYSFSDAEGDFDLSTYQWYRSDDLSGTNKTSISGATNSLYMSTSHDVGKYLSVEVTPKDAFRIGTPVESALQGPVTNPFTKGSGTEAEPYQITTLRELQAVGAFLNHHFILMNDIDASATSGWNGGTGFDPIGSTFDFFTGTINGQNFVIQGLTINRPNVTKVGLVAMNKGTLKNLQLVDITVLGYSIVGGLVGENRSTIYRCSVKGDITGLSYFLGGLVGYNIGDIGESHASGVISGYDSNTNTRADFIGGLVGTNSGNINYSYAAGTVVGGNLVGGLIGDNTGHSVTNSYAKVNVSGYLKTGGFAGLNEAWINNSYSVGFVSGANAGGFVADNFRGSVLNSFWDEAWAYPVQSSQGGTLKTTSQMQNISTYTSAGWDFNTIWGIDPDVNDGYPFLQEQQGNSHIILGNEGWRMMASPVSGASFSSLLDGLWTQGFSGASTASGSPNIYFWDEATQSFIAPDSAGQVPAPGRGFIQYVFADEDNDGSPEGFPKSLSTSGSQHSGQLAPTLSFTNTDSIEADGWNLVGNPYGTTINWNAPNGWSKANLDATIYVWSDSASGGAGAYKSWNGTTGTLGSGKIAPWQGFWVKANAESPSMTVTDSVRNTGGVFLKQAPIPEIRLRLSTTSAPSAGGEQGVGHSGLRSTAIISFQQGASEGKDPFDAYKLQSLNGEYLSLGTSINNEAVMDIQAFPFDLEETELELDIRGSNLTGGFTLSWNPKAIPEEWQLSLIDRETGEEYVMSEEGSFGFELQPKAKQAVRADSHPPQRKAQTLRGNPQYDHQNLPIPNSPVRVLQKNKTVPSRFLLRIKTGTTVSTGSESDLPTRVELQQNFPNPFNPSTTINYGVPQKGQVVLEVFNVLGQKVALLVNANQNAGRYSVNFDASGLSSGLYFYRLQTNGKVITEKMMLVK